MANIQYSPPDNPCGSGYYLFVCSVECERIGESGVLIPGEPENRPRPSLRTTVPPQPPPWTRATSVNTSSDGLAFRPDGL